MTDQEHDPLARRMIPCPDYIPWDQGDGPMCANLAPCRGCEVVGITSEPAEVWAERLKGMLEYAIEELAHYWTGHTDAEAKQYVVDAAMKYYTARLLAAEKATGDTTEIAVALDKTLDEAKDLRNKLKKIERTATEGMV